MNCSTTCAGAAAGTIPAGGGVVVAPPPQAAVAASSAKASERIRQERKRTSGCGKGIRRVMGGPRMLARRTGEVKLDGRLARCYAALRENMNMRSSDSATPLLASWFAAAWDDLR